MKKRSLHPPLALAAGLLLGWLPSSHAAAIFAEDFNAYTDFNQNTLQYDTGLYLAHSGNLPGWNKAGGGAVHGVDRDATGLGPSDWAPMIWQDNVLTLIDGIAANDAGIAYSVEFVAGPTVYAAGGQATAATDGIVISVLRADNTVLAAHNHLPGAWAAAQTFEPASFQYVGDGSGPVRLRVGPLVAAGRFGGAIDDLKVFNVGAGSVPTITAQPTGGTVPEGGDFTFRVEATGASSYVWRKNTTPIAGATGATLALSNVKPTDAGTYSVVVSNPVGSVTSGDAVLNVTPGPTYASYREAVLADKPIHYYQLDETTGTVAADLGSQATAGGTYLGGFTLGKPSALPSLGTCVQLDGTPGTMVDLGLFHPGDAVTAEAWFYLDPTATHSPEYHIIVSRFEGSYEIDIAPGNFVNWNFFNDSGTFGQAASLTPAARGVWHHVVGVFSEGTGTVYVDGVTGGPGPQTGNIIGGVLQDLGPTPDRVMIGATRNGETSSFNWKGMIDEVAIYNTALSAAQVRAHFRAAQPPPPSLTIQDAVMVSWPNFPVGYVLQWADAVAGPYVDYTGHTYIEVSNLIAPVPVGPTPKFFRLFKP